MDAKTKAAIIITMCLVPLVYITVILVLTGSFSNDIKAMVAGTIVGSLLGAISGYWLGGVHGPATPAKDPAPDSTSNLEVPRAESHPPAA